jgi:hypothetical protein
VRAADGERLRRRRAAELAGGTLIQGSGPRFEALNASTRRAQVGKASRAKGRGGVAAERRVNAAARRGSSGGGSKATGCTGTPTSGTEGPLTSLRSSWAISRRRSGGGSGESAAVAGTRARVPAARAKGGGSTWTARVGRP